MSTVLVTGDAGFIGSVVRRKLELQGHRVVGVDLRNDAPVDVRCLRQLSEVFSQHHIAGVVHLAALMPPDASDWDMFETNVQGTVNVLTCCKRFQVSRLVFASSAAVYGDGDTDEDSELHPISPYGMSKLIAEEVLQGADLGSVGVLRFFNVYGDGGHGVVDLLRECVRSGAQFEMRGDGTAVRDFVPVELIAEALVDMLALTRRLTLNVGLGHGVTVQELLEAALAIREFHVCRVPSLAGEIDCSIAKVERFQRVLPWLYEKYRRVRPLEYLESSR